MPINKGKAFSEGDVYIDYPYEDVMFRWEHATKKIYRKFYGKEESSDPVPEDNRLLNEAISAGEKITREEYFGRKSDE